MAKLDDDNKHLESVAKLTYDITDIDNKKLARLHGLLAETLKTAPDTNADTILTRLTKLDVSGATRNALEALRNIRLTATDRKILPVHVERVDDRANLINVQLATPLSAVGGAERLGPFIVDGGRVWFDFYRPARRFVVTETGASAPAFVMNSARRPLLPHRGPLTLDLQKGTVWIRGNLIDNALPAGAYVGITVSDGKLILPHIVLVDTGEVEITAPVQATLMLTLDPGSVTASASGCKPHCSITLPELTFTFNNGGSPSIDIGNGETEVWGQAFEFSGATGTKNFIARLWTVVLGTTVKPQAFNAGAITSDLADYQGTASVTSAGLGLPIVVADPAILGAAQVSPSWWLALDKLEARWYAADERFHAINGWMGVNLSGVTLFSAAVPALDAPVSSDYRLWELKDASGHRLPWRHSYDDDFLFYYRYDVVRGEDLLTTGSAKVVLDRPVQTNGSLVRTPTTLGAFFEHKPGNGPVSISLAALVDANAPQNQLALRNALCWATRAALLIAHGDNLIDRNLIHNGSLTLLFGVYAWTPTLPDPYVGNFQVCRPPNDTLRALLAANVVWTSPGDVTTTFTGQLGPPIVCAKPASDPTPQPLAQTKLEVIPDIGLTQTAQHKLHLTEKEQELWDSAQTRERDRRVAEAGHKNSQSLSALDGYTRESLGATPPVFLLDVSTNQDLLGVALWASEAQRETTKLPTGTSNFSVQALDVQSPVETLRLVTLPQIQWEPVRTLDEDQDLLTLGWFPTPLASATDGGATVLGARWQKLAPVIPEAVLNGTLDAFGNGTEVTFRTTLPFGLVTVATVNPKDQPGRAADTYELSRPEFVQENARGGIQITAKAEGGPPDDGSISPCFAGMTRQLINGVDLVSGAPLGLSVLASTGDPMGDVETIFNNDMVTNPKVPVTRFDLSGYGASNFSKWEDPLALFAATSKTQFQVIVGRTALEIIKVASVLHPWGIRVTRSVIVERKSGGGVIRRDTGWQATSPGLFDYRYYTTGGGAQPKVAPYVFDAGLFKGLFNIRSIRPAPGVPFSDGASTTMVPYYFDADLKLDSEGTNSMTQAVGVLGWLQTAPSGNPAPAAALKQLIEAQGPIGGPIDTLITFGASGLPFRARRIEVGLANDAGTPVFVATVRGIPKFPKTGAWSVARRDIQGAPPGGNEAVSVSDTNGVPIVRRYPIEYAEGDTHSYTNPPLKGGSAPGDWRFADADDLLLATNPNKEYCILQSTPTHAFLFPRPYSQSSVAAQLLSDVKPEFADIIARATSKGAFPPPENAIKLSATRHFNVGTGGTLALSSPVSIVGYPTPLRLSGSNGHGTELLYDTATLQLEINDNSWSAEFNGLELWNDIAGMHHTSGARLRVVGSTTQRPQITRIDTLVQESIEKIMTFLPIFGARESLGPVDLGASNLKREIKIEVAVKKEVPKGGWSVGNNKIKLSLGSSASTGFDLKTGGIKNSGTLSAGLKGEFGTTYFIVVQLDVKFKVTSVSGAVTKETFDLLAFVGVGVGGQIGPFKAKAYMGVGFVLSYDITIDKAKYGGLVRLEASVELHVVTVKLTAELKGLVYNAAEKTLCDYSGDVKLHVEIFLIISINASYSFSGTKDL